MNRDEVPVAQLARDIAWEYGRHLEPNGSVWRHRLPGSGFACAFPAGPGEIIAVSLRDGLMRRAASGDWAPDPLPESVHVSYAWPGLDGLLVLRRSDMTISVRSPVSERYRICLEELSLSEIPATACVTDDGLIVMAFPDYGTVLGAHPDGVLAFRTGREEGLTEPVGVWPVKGGTFLVADAGAHCVFWFDTSFGPHVLYGRPAQAGSRPGCLNAPRFVSSSPWGTILVTDTKNNRVLELDKDGSLLRRIGPCFTGVSDQDLSGPHRLWYPNTAVGMLDKRVLIAEGRGSRIFQVHRDGTADMLGGACDAAPVNLDQPRGAYFSGKDIVITDCHHDRILVISEAGGIRATIPSRPSPAEPLFDWPRFAATVGEDLVVADGRQHRLVRVSKSGRIIWTLLGYMEGDDPSTWTRFRDPHHVVVLREDPLVLLTTDSDYGRVVRVNASGVADWVYTGLVDPHMAVPLSNGDVLICDTGHDRVLTVAMDGGLTWQLAAATVARCTGEPMRSPRATLRTKCGTTIIADTGNHRLLAASGEASVRSLEVRTTELAGSLFSPRYLALDDSEEILLITDFDNSRVIAIRLAALLD